MIMILRQQDTPVIIQSEAAKKYYNHTKNTFTSYRIRYKGANYNISRNQRR